MVGMVTLENHAYMHSAKGEICTALCDYTHSAEYHDGMAKSNHAFKLVARSQVRSKVRAVGIGHQQLY